MLKYCKLIGALTSKPYAFTSRPWEITTTNSIDILDILGSNIRIDSYGSQIKRILPLKNDKVNREYISNRVRFFFDGLNRWRLITPILKNNNDFLFSSWNLVFPYIYLKFFTKKNALKKFSFFFDNFTDVNAIFFAKKLSDLHGFGNYETVSNLNNYYNYYINPNLLDLLPKKKIFLFFGSNIRLESPVLNIRLRNTLVKSNTTFGMFGSNRWDNLNSISLGSSTKDIVNFFSGKSRICKLILHNVLNTQVLKWSELSHIFVGSNILNRGDLNNIINILHNFGSKNNLYAFKTTNNFYCTIKNLKLKENLSELTFNKVLLNVNNISFLYNNLNSLLFNEFNLAKNKIRKNLDIAYFVGNNSNIKNYVLGKSLVLFQGHHTNYANLKNIDILLPTLNFFEKRVPFLNIEGFVQNTNVAVSNLSNSKSDWVILNSLFLYFAEMLIVNNKLFNLKSLSLNRYKDFLYNFKLKKLKDLRFFSLNLFFKDLTKYSYYNYNNFHSLPYNYKKINNLYYSSISSYNMSPYTLDIISINSKWMVNAEESLQKTYTNFLKF